MDELKLSDAIQRILENNHFDISLQGWPAAITAVSFFGSCVLAYSIKLSHTT